MRVGARGATATLGAATDPRVQVSGASLAVLARKADAAASPTFAVIASGNAALVAATGITLTGANWRVAYNDLGDLSAAPVAVETGAGSVSVAFAANVRSVTGTGTVTVSTLGGVTGTFAVTAASGQLTAQVSDASSAVTAGTASARLSSASGTFTITATGLTGSAQGALSLEGLPGLTAQGTLDLQVDSAATIPYFRLVGTGRLAIAAFLELSGTLQFERSGPDVGVTVTGTATSASLSLSSTGAITGSGTTHVALPVSIPGLTLDGTATLAISPTSISASGAVTLTTPVGEATGSLTFTKNLALNELSVSGTGITLFLGNRGASASSDAGLVLGSAAADAVIRSNGSYALRVSGNASLANVSSATVAFSGGPFVAELNTTGADVTLGTATVAADTSRFAGIGVTLTVAGFSAVGTFAVQSSVSAGAREVLLAAVGVAASAGPVQVTSADLLFLIASDGKLTLQATGAATIAGTTALTLSGNVGFKYNTRQARVTRELIVAGLTRLLDVQAASSSGAFASFGGESLALGILGQELSGDFDLLAGGGNVSVTITNAKLKLGGGLVRAEALSAIGFQISALGAISATALAFDSVVVNAPSIGVNGSVSASLDVGGSSNHVKVAVGSTSAIANLDVAGQTISGVFTFEQTGAGLVTVDAQNVSVTLGTVASATASGQLQLAADGLAAKLTAQVSVLSVPTVTFAATPYTGSLDLNTRPTAVAALSLPAGPFVRLTIAVSSPLDVGGLGTIQGTFSFQRSGTGPSALTFVGISGGTLVIGTQSITNGEGALLITGTGVAGFVSGTFSSATVVVSVNTTGGAVDQTLNVGGRELAIRFGPDESPIFRLSVSGLSLNIGGGVTIEGNLVFETRGDGSRVFAGTGLRIFFGDGPLILANGERNPLARGIVLTNATIGLLNDGTDYALDALGDFELVGAGNVTVSGQGHVRVNTFEDDIDETLTIPGGTATVTVKFTGTSQQGSAGGPYVAVSGIGLELKLMGQSLTGDLSFQKTTGGLKVVASNVELALGDNGSGESARGPPFLTLSNAAGELVITSSGVVAKLTGGVQLALDGVSLTGAFDLLVNTTGNPGTAGGTSLLAGPYFRLTTVSATATLTVLGVQLSGRFTVEQALENGAAVTRLSATGVQLSLKAGATEVLSFGSGAGSLTLSSAGIVGSLSASVSTDARGLQPLGGRRDRVRHDRRRPLRARRGRERDGDPGRRRADARRGSLVPLGARPDRSRDRRGLGVERALRLRRGLAAGRLAHERLRAPDRRDRREDRRLALGNRCHRRSGRLVLRDARASGEHDGARGRHARERRARRSDAGVARRRRRLRPLRSDGRAAAGARPARLRRLRGHVVERGRHADRRQRAPRPRRRHRVDHRRERHLHVRRSGDLGQLHGHAFARAAGRPALRSGRLVGPGADRHDRRHALRPDQRDERRASRRGSGAEGQLHARGGCRRVWRPGREDRRRQLVADDQPARGRPADDRRRVRPDRPVVVWPRGQHLDRRGAALARDHGRRLLGRRDRHRREHRRVPRHGVVPDRDDADAAHAARRPVREHPAARLDADARRELADRQLRVRERGRRHAPRRDEPQRQHR